MRCRSKLRFIIIILCFIIPFFGACHSKPYAYKNVDKIHIEVRNCSILNFKGNDHTITDQTEILKIIKLVGELRKDIHREKENYYSTVVGASTYYITLYSKEKILQEYKFFLSKYLTIKDSTGETVDYYLHNSEELESYLINLTKSY
ncbi:MAG: hypothetical protein IC227_04815 [Enterococcus lacertideformus]|uniref:Uncharacterized protein n=1 Tax=Enterococcus lacertideformus TaxID=2771493 RepID=A0A931FAU6_9ENTE|nr:hypothetical protein [Enterococcus lacertideformus]